MSKLNSKVAVYAGSFDPVTYGHLWMIEEGAKKYDRLIVAVGTNPEKNSYFTIEERIEMLNAITLSFSNVEIDSYKNMFMVHYARDRRAGILLRGVRNSVDEAYEEQMRFVNKKIDPEIETEFMYPPEDIGCISSSLVKGSMIMDRWEEVVAKFVPLLVLQNLRMKMNNKKSL